jgi:import inner membrane translocase subunit TIM23
MGCVGLGWLSGPTVGGALWRLTHRGVISGMEAKDRIFHDHIVRNRVDPSRQSVSNPVPDYYGAVIWHCCIFLLFSELGQLTRVDDDL